MPASEKVNNMKIENTHIPGLLIIQPDILNDDRGYFFESFSSKKYEALGKNINFIQDNFSKSKINTVRGLHYQTGKSAQGKLCQVIKGNVLDVAVDIRFGSPAFGKYFSIELSEENHLQLWIPAGFAHGFSVLSEETVFHYKCTELYNKDSERSIRFNDPDLNIDWKVEQQVVSPKDLNGKLFKEIEKDFSF
jgi:dTDP-4-dehydrorhamnose 3,5-epimerase